MNEDNKDGAGEEIEVLVDDTNEGDAGTAGDKAAGAAGDGASNAAGVEDIHAQFEAAQKRADEAQKRAEAAERLASQREVEAATARSATASAEMTAIDNAIANNELQRTDAKQRLAQALQEGDYDKVAEAQSELADIAIKSQRMKEGKNALERRQEDIKNGAAAAADPVEQYVKQLSPASASWVRSHPEVVTDGSKRSALERAHYSALGEGLTVDSPDYFAHMDRKMGYAGGDDDTTTVTQQQTRTQSAPAAPVSRGGAADAPKARPTTIRLTAAQREIAAACGMTDAEYAKQLLAIQRDSGATTH